MISFANTNSNTNTTFFENKYNTAISSSKKGSNNNFDLARLKGTNNIYQQSKKNKKKDKKNLKCSDIYMACENISKIKNSGNVKSLQKNNSNNYYQYNEYDDKDSILKKSLKNVAVGIQDICNNSNEIIQYFCLIKKRENIKNLFINEYKKLDIKKEKMWKYEDIKKWGINYEKNKNFDIDNVKLLKDKNYAKKKMLYKETQELEIIKNNFGYINHMNKEGVNFLLDNFINGFKVFIMNFVKEFYPTLNDFINFWSDLSIFVN